MSKLKKNKLKTHKGTKKRFKVTGGGKLVKLKGRMIKKSKISKNARRTLGKAMVVNDSYVSAIKTQLNIKSSSLKKSTVKDPSAESVEKTTKAS